MAFTAQLGTADSYLGNIVVGLGAEYEPSLPYLRRHGRGEAPIAANEPPALSKSQLATAYLADASVGTGSVWQPMRIFERLLEVPTEQPLKDQPKLGYRFVVEWLAPSQPSFEVELIPWDRTEPNRKLLRHQQRVSNVLNSLLRSLQIIKRGADSFEIYPDGVPYTPAVASDWESPAPATLQDALDRIAMALRVLGQKP